MTQLRVLVACESSGRVRDAFRRLGHDAVSCDLDPPEVPGPHHQGDVLQFARSREWDAIIAFPPCTHLAVSGAAHFAAKRADGRQRSAINFFLDVGSLAARFKAIENPVGIMSSVWRKPSQIIQPWMFGADASKKTCLWLDELPPLTPTKIVDGRWVCCGRVLPDKHGCPNCAGEKTPAMRWANQTDSGQNKLSPGPERARERSRTYQGVADAMADQWAPHMQRVLGRRD